MREGILLPLAGGRSTDDHRTVFLTWDEAHEDARNRLLVWRVASGICLDLGVPEGEVVRVRLHGQDGRVLFEGVR